MKKLFHLIFILLFLGMFGCAAFQPNPLIKTFDGQDLYKYIDAKADTSQNRLVRVVTAYNGLYSNQQELLKKLEELNTFLNKESKDGKIDNSTIQGLNSRGFSLELPDPVELPANLPDSVPAADSSKVRKK